MNSLDRNNKAKIAILVWFDRYNEMANFQIKMKRHMVRWENMFTVQQDAFSQDPELLVEVL